MLRAMTLSALLVIGSGLAFSETFTGMLVDANCAAQQKSAACTPTATTTTFALQVAGKMLKLDADGNRKAADAIKDSSNSADRAKDPNAGQGNVTARVDGTLNGDEIKVDTVAIQ